MATTITYTSDGVTRDLAVPFPYMSKSHVYVFVDGIATVAFTWPSQSVIRLNPEVTLTEGAQITLSRRTPTGTNPVTFRDGSVLGEGDLNLIATYAAFVTEEAREFTDRAEAAAANAALDRDQVAANTATTQEARDEAVAAAEAAALFDPALYVPRAGGVTLTGHLAVPAGATGSQVPRASEVLLAGATGNSTARKNFVSQTAHGVANADFGLAPLVSRGKDAGAAVLAFERPGIFAALLGLDTDNALAFGGGSLGATRYRVFHEGLGDSFLAAGGIEEHGANANGYYWRTRQGFQICYRTVACVSGGAVSALWPAAFVGSGAYPVHVAGLSPEAGPRTLTASSVDLYGCQASLWTDTGVRAAGVGFLVALGRWK